MYDNPNYYSSADQFLGANGITPQPYLDPVETIRRFANNDYEAPPKLDNYEQPHPSNIFDDVRYELADYPLPTGVISNTLQSSILPADGATLSEDEQIYEDPGHIKEEIYEWFKQRNIFKIDKNSIRYINILIFK